MLRAFARIFIPCLPGKLLLTAFTNRSSTTALFEQLFYRTHFSQFTPKLSSKMDMPSSNSTMMSMMSMSDMTMVFYTSTATPLYSSEWMPTSVGQYMLTCIFLIFLAAVLRGLLALKAVQEVRWLDAEFNRRYVVVAGKNLKEQISQDSDMKKMVLSANGVEEDVFVVAKKTSGVRPWRISTDGPRAALDTIIAGVGYLL